jgi:F-type H+-transporting ATPase subunit b
MDNFPHPPTLLMVAAAVVALVFILNRFLFRPINEILAKRQAEVDEARAEFERARQLQEERFAEIEDRLSGARKEAFGIRESAQQEARDERDAVLAAARADAMKSVETAKAEIREQVDQARKQLDEDAQGLARQIVEQLLGRPVDKEQS